ncbi:methionine--tRNA ligase [Candidatus Hecatella orcuttiae]|jgi:methionyl-tRNA synthetase|uniref:methionine--tRNA ligase n=1 Tax=Candidatus Hecatella orcuttiae TaxID=1935119 RepID=UPI002867CB47|nr:methionine--tRNA ligase [Candidatus Hecatella orcuttiae]
MIGSAWPYINYMPHLGTIIGSVLSADVAARYLRMKGEDVVLVSGSDEHGTPIELEAVRQGIPPKKLTDENHRKVKKLFERWALSFDNYTRTESPVHIRFVQDFFRKIYSNGYIFTEEVVFPHCPRCRRFLPDRFIQGKCPRCGFEAARGDQCDACGWPLDPSKLVEPVCALCGETPSPKTTKHWYFDLPRFTHQLESYVKENPRLPENARNFSLNLIREGLKPRPITRDTEWGIPAPFPGAEGKTIYVWMEAVLGYVSATLEHFQRLGQEDRWRDFWLDPEARTVYFIGKDNIPFHTIILPALLLASGEGYNLPWTVNSTEFLMFEGQKFSKSRRIGIWIDEALRMFPADYWRYTLISIRPEVKDTSFSWSTFLEKVNSDLNDTFGNLVHRTLTFIGRHFEGKIPTPEALDIYDGEMLKVAKEAQKEFERNLEQFKLQAAVLTVMDLARKANKYVNDKEPWRTVKTEPSKAAATLYVAAKIVKTLGILLQPFIPSTADVLLEKFGVKPGESRKLWDELRKELASGQKLGKPKVLFKKTSLEEVEKKLKELEQAGKKEERISAEELSRLNLRVGRIVDVQPVAGSRKLLRLKIDLGEEGVKAAAAGLGECYQPEELRDRLVAVVANIQPVKILGVHSEVMVLAADDGTGKFALLTPDRAVKSGSKIR